MHAVLLGLKTSTSSGRSNHVPRARGPYPITRLACQELFACPCSPHSHSLPRQAVPPPIILAGHRKNDLRNHLRWQCASRIRDPSEQAVVSRLIARAPRALSQDCFERVSKYLEDVDKDAAGYILASEVSGIALVSEDATALAEAKKIGLCASM